MNIIHKITKNISVYFLGQVCIFIANFFTIVLLTRNLGVENFGIFNYGIIYVSYFAVFANFGMKPIIFREFSRNLEARDLIFNSALLIKLILNFFVWIIVCVSAIVFHKDTQIIRTILILSFLLFFATKTETFRIIFELYFQAELNVTKPIFLQVLDSLVLIISIFIASKLHLAYYYYLLIYIIAFLPGFILIAFFCLHKVKLRLKFDLGTIKFLLRESLPLFIFVSLMTIQTRLDVFLLKFFGDFQDIGYYSGAFRLVNPLSLLAAATIVSLYPLLIHYIKTDEKKLKLLISLVLKILIFISTFISISVYFYGDEILIFLFSDKYESSIQPFKILIWSQIFNFILVFLIEFNNSIYKQKSNISVAVIILLINFLFCVLLIPQYTYIGASYAKLISLFIGAFWIIFFTRFYITKNVVSAIIKILIVIPFIFIIDISKSLNLFVGITGLFILISSYLYFIRYLNAQEKSILQETIMKILFPKNN
jgi:O-antigen/teichoic acid export membrane protein